MKFLSKALKRSVWVFITVFFAILLCITIVGGQIMKENASSVNGFLKLNPYVKVNTDDENAEYFKSDYLNADGTYDDVSMRKNSLEVAEKVASEGTTLLWNDNKALPLKENDKVSLFGIASVNYATGSSGGSGGVAAQIDKNFKQTLETPVSEGGAGLSVNDKLWNFYSANAFPYNGAKYGGWRMVKGNAAKDSRYNSDPKYVEFSVVEAPWTALESGIGGDIVDDYGDAAIMTISRNSGEDGDVWFTTNECYDNTYLDLSYEEAGVLEKLSALKKTGKIKKIIVILNVRSSLQFEHLKTYGVDACLFASFGGNVTYTALSNVLSGKTNPSGHLTDTLVNDMKSIPSNMNTGDFKYTEVASGVPAATDSAANDKYVVYQEGIYVGYRYFETRYEDSVIGGRNANGLNGVAAGKDAWKYSDEVAYSFGHGVSYTTFSYENYSVTKDGDNYKVSLTIKNTGTLSGREVMQVYLQKPYTSYDMSNGIEKSAIELVGFAKTKLLGSGESQTLTITVKEEDFKTYDANGEKTYILEKGDYYIATGTSAHNALNNVLAAKGYKTSDGMDEKGEANLARKITIARDDFKKYSKSTQTGAEITNAFDDVDLNRYEGTTDQKIVYLSRKDWQGTYPVSPVSLKCTSEIMVRDMQYAHLPEQKEGDEMPKMGEITSEMGELSLAMIKDLDYNDPLWQDLLNQLTWSEMNYLATYGYLFLAGAISVNAPGAKAQDGPLGIRTANERLGNTYMGFPSAILMAGTWDTALIEQFGIAFGHEIMHVDYDLIYATGVNIHRSPYDGRAAEYYSEDGYMSGVMSAAAIKGIRSKGVMVCVKHYALNEQEKNRRAVSTFANEQSIREIYLKPFEMSVDAGADSLMSSLNRVGCSSSVVHKGLLTDVLRGEWGFKGFVESDSAFGLEYIIADDVKAEAIVAGSDVWMLGGSTSAWDKFKNNATVVKALRESCHRVLYAQSQSVAMNGMSEGTKIAILKMWWENAIDSARIAVAVITGICALITISAFILNASFKKQEGNSI